MAVLSKISVGDIIYYTVDDVPTHSASKGSIAILSTSESPYENSMMWVNNNGGSIWLKIISPAYGEITLNNGTTGIIADGTQVLGSWYAFNASDTWTLGNTDTYKLYGSNNYSIQYTGDTLIRNLVTQNSTMRGGTTNWINWQIGVSYNFFVPNRFQTCFSFDNSATVNCASKHIVEMNTNDFVLAAISPVSRKSGGGGGARTYIPKYCQVTSLKLDEALKIVLVNEDFESSGFTQQSWNLANDSENIWVVGQAQSNGGTSAAYISNNGGTSATYNVNNPEVSHFYKNFTFSSGVTSLSLVFDWKCQGENSAGATQYDYGCVVITDTSTNPVAGSEVITTIAPSGGNGRLGATINLGKFNLAYGTTPGTVWNTETVDLTPYIGQTKRIVFTWVNDSSVGANPPFVIDNIRIVSYKW